MDRLPHQPSDEAPLAAMDPTRLATSGMSVLGHIANWTDSRLPLPELLRAIADEYSVSSRKALWRLAERLESGDSLEQAFEATRKLFPAGLRRPLSLAASGGDLQTTLPALAANEATRKDLRRQIVSSLVYPVTIFVCCVFLALTACWVAIPQFASIFDEFELELPAMTELVINTARWLPLGIAGTVIAVGVGLVLWVTPALRVFVHWVATATPLFGTLWIWISHHALCQQLAAYLSAQTPLPSALRGAAVGLGNRSLAGAVDRIAASCEQGASLSQAMEQSIHVERMLTRMVQWGESCDNLPEAFSEAASIYRRQIETYLVFVRRIATPCMIVTIGAVVAFMITAMFVPLIGLIENLS